MRRYIKLTDFSLLDIYHQEPGPIRHSLLLHRTQNGQLQTEEKVGETLTDENKTLIRSISRFPSLDHLVLTGVMREDELRLFRQLDDKVSSPVISKPDPNMELVRNLLYSIINRL